MRGDDGLGRDEKRDRILQRQEEDNEKAFIELKGVCNSATNSSDGPQRASGTSERRGGARRRNFRFFARVPIILLCHASRASRP